MPLTEPGCQESFSKHWWVWRVYQQCELLLLYAGIWKICVNSGNSYFPNGQDRMSQSVWVSKPQERSQDVTGVEGGGCGSRFPAGKLPESIWLQKRKNYSLLRRLWRVPSPALCIYGSLDLSHTFQPRNRLQQPECRNTAPADFS